MLLRLIVLAAVLGNSVSFHRPASTLLRTAHLQLSPHDIVDPVQHAVQHHAALGDGLNSMLVSAEEAVSAYSKVDKTGFIGFIATYVEIAIDAFHSGLQSVGVQNSYGYSIMAFTLLVKLITLPLTQTQLASTTMMQKMAPLQKTIQEKYANDEQMRNQLVAQLFQAAQINPLAGCFPALVQLPIFISLYRALQNLVAENKLDEPFLWIPDLEGPVYSAGPGTSMDWVKSIFSGNPSLGWHDTLCFLSLPVILFVSQTISTKVLQPPRDPTKELTDQEQFSQNLVSNLPFIVAFFSLNVPSGLGVYWIVNNILTTLVTVGVKRQFADQELPIEAVQFMAQIEADTTRGQPKTKTSTGMEELRSAIPQTELKPKEGFGAGPAVPLIPTGPEASEGEKVADVDPEHAAASQSMKVSEEKVIDAQIVEPTESTEEAPKRKKRVKPAQRKKGKK